MNLEELMQYTEEIKSETRFLPEIPLWFFTKKLENPFYRQITVNNSANFEEFLTFLYYVFRKIELKLEKRHPDLIYTLRSKRNLPTLEEAKENFKSVEKSDFIRMYPVMKQLFYCYTQYIKTSLETNTDITEGNNLPCTVDELKYWLRKLNVNSISTCSGYGRVIQKLNKTKKFKEWDTMIDNAITQPCINIGNETVCFGFANMERADRNAIPEDALPLVKRCAKNCTEDFRRWICKTCGDFVLIKDWVLYCSCGSKEYKDKLLVCAHEYRCKWDTRIAPVLMVPPGYERLHAQLIKTAKYANIRFLKDNEAREAYIGDSHGGKHIFGFVNMSGVQWERTPDDAKLLQRPCPNDCTDNSRKWICTKCGEYVWFKNWTLYCLCGSKEYNDELLICHKKELSPEANSFRTQFKKGDSKNPKAIDVMSTCTDKDLLLRTLNELKKSVNNETKNIIDDALNNYESLFTLVRTEFFICGV